MGCASSTNAASKTSAPKQVEGDLPPSLLQNPKSPSKQTPSVITTGKKTIVRVDVDTQVGFCLPEGSLYVEAPASVLQNVRTLIHDAEEKRICLLGCVDSHSYDAWEFQANGGPFPAHCVKGTSDWLKIPGTLPKRFRFVPMSQSGALMIGENKEGGGNRTYTSKEFSKEVREGVGAYFEKEVYSAFCNPNAEAMLQQLVLDLGGSEHVTFQVFGYCTGGYCVDGFAEGLRGQGFNVDVVLDATAAIGGDDGLEKSRKELTAKGCRIITTEEALGA